MNKISTRELLSIVISLTCCLFPMFGTSIIIYSSKNSALLSISIGYLIGFIPLLLIIYIFNNLDENKNIFEFNISKLHFIGRIINVLLYVYSIYIGIIISWRILDFTITNLLPENSYYILSIILFSIMGYAVTKGKEVISRSNTILTIILIIILGFISIFLIPNVKLDNLLPIFNVSKMNFIKGALTYQAVSVYPLITILSIKPGDIVDRNNFKKCLIMGYSITYVIIMIFYFLLISNFGSNFASILSFPEYYLFKNINAFDFIQRVENICSMTYFIVSFGGICYLIFFAKESIISTFCIKDKKKENIFILILANIIPIISVYLFQKYHMNFLINNYLKYTLYIIILILIEGFLILITRKRKKN